MAFRVSKYLSCDFETTVYDGQKKTEVWAAASTELFSGNDDVRIDHSIGDMFDYLFSLKSNLVCYFHNLKFDGVFILSHFLIDRGYKLALDIIQSGDKVYRKWREEKDMDENSFKCSISAMGQWYSIKLRKNGKIIDIRDSLKLLPFSVHQIGESFKTKHRKLEMEYKGFRYPGCVITDEERQYIANDVLVVKEALEFMFKEGHNRLTIGSCCLEEFKKTQKNFYESLFPDVYQIPIDEQEHNCKTAGEWVHKSYKGAWCYFVEGKECKLYKNGGTWDVNSLYPSMMHSESGNRYPVGRPTFFSSVTIHDLDLIEGNQQYYFIRIKTRFYLKKGKLPFVQIKDDLRFRGNESLKTSDYLDKKDGKYYTHYWKPDADGNLQLHDTRVELTMTMTDFRLFREHYNLVDLEIIDGCYFNTEIGLFDEYIDKYKEIKMNSKGAMRQLAKLFLNNLYGKMASSTDSSFKIPLVRENGSIGLIDQTEKDKQPGYIPIGSAITSYARNFTIRAAQMNYHGVDKPGFIYADTDSIHCDLAPDEVLGIKVHPTNFCCWKMESSWDRAWFTRQKTYIEHIVKEDGEDVKPYYNIKCAGMPEKCKELFAKSLEGYEITDEEKKENKYTPEETATIESKYKMEDFIVGITIPGKLVPKRIPGGVLLVETTYKMRPR